MKSTPPQTSPPLHQVIPQARTRLESILETLDGFVPVGTLAEIRGCFEAVSEAVFHLSTDVANLQQRMTSLETRGAAAPSTTYAAVAASTSTRPAEFPPLRKPATRRQRPRKKSRSQQMRQHPDAPRRARRGRSKKGKIPAVTSQQENASKPPPIKSAFARAAKRKPPPKHTVFVSAPAGPDQPDALLTAAELRSKLMSSVNPARDGIRVRNLRATAGGRLVLEVNSAGDLAKLRAHEGLQASGLQIAPTTLKSPRVIVYDVPLDVEAEALTDAVWRQNPAVSDIAWSDFQESFIPRQQIQKGASTCNWIVSVSSAVRDKLRTAQRIFALWSRCRVLDYLVPTRCYKCQEYGHVARHCASDTDTCGHCAGLHTTRNCQHKARKPVCAPCARRKLKASHGVQSRDCPTYKRAAQRELGRTNYG